MAMMEMKKMILLIMLRIMINKTTEKKKMNKINLIFHKKQI